MAYNYNMGSCKSLGVVKPKTPTQVLSNLKTPLCITYSVTIEEVTFLSHLYRELCIRNNSKSMLEKSTFLLLISIPVITNQGMLGERIFDFYDKNKDGYIDEDTFLHIIEKFSKCEAAEIYQELFVLCDLKSDNIVDKQELSQTVKFTQINGILLDILNNMMPTLLNTNSLGVATNKLSNFAASTSTMGSFTESIVKNKQSPETIINDIFEKFSSNSVYLTFTEFKQCLSSQFWILCRLKESFKIDSWKNENGMKLKAPRVTQNLTTLKTIQTISKVYSRGKWVKKILVIKDVFLEIYSEKRNIEQIFLIEGCHFKMTETFLYLIYSSQYDERVTFQFDSVIECSKFLDNLNQACPIRRAKNFYKKEEKIGYGKFSEVFKVTEILTGQTFALKKIKKNSMNQAEREMIRKEISILKNFSNPGIIKLKDVFDSRKNVKIVLEYVESGDLLKKIKSEDVEESKVKEIIKKILETTKYLHSLGVIHRDLKPENILVEENSEGIQLKFIDFGLATYTLPGEIKSLKCGTLGYTAPEIFLGRYTNKVDVWSIGVILYACLTGKLPFFSYSRTEMVEMTQNQELQFDSAKWEKYSSRALEFTKSLLNKNPDLRPSCEEALTNPWFLE